MNQPEDLKIEFDEKKFEEELLRMMRRVDAPAGFADRVMARVDSPARAPARVVVMRPRAGAWFGGAIAAALLLGVFFTEQTHLRHEREQAMQAQVQFEVGMRATDRALEHARQQLQRAGVGPGD